VVQQWWRTTLAYRSMLSEFAMCTRFPLQPTSSHAEGQAGSTAHSRSKSARRSDSLRDLFMFFSLVRRV